MTKTQMSRSLATLVVVVMTLGACEGGNDEPQKAPPRLGGADALPGPVPPGVSFDRGDRSSPPAPDFSLSLLDGTRVSGSSLWRKRPVVLFFFASWCEICAEQQADLTALGERYEDTVVVLGIAGEDTAEDVAGFLERHDAKNAVAIDAGLDSWRDYAVREPPHVVVIAKGGRVFRGWPGGASRTVIEEALSELVQR